MNDVRAEVPKEARLRLLVGCVGQGQHPCSDESALDDPRLRELLALAALAAFGCGLALAQGDLLFAGLSL